MFCGMKAEFCLDTFLKVQLEESLFIAALAIPCLPHSHPFGQDKNTPYFPFSQEKYAMKWKVQTAQKKCI